MDIMKADNEMPEKLPPPWVPAGILVGLFILGALLEAFNWTPFW